MIDPKDPGTVDLFGLSLFEWRGLVVPPSKKAESPEIEPPDAVPDGERQ